MTLPTIRTHVNVAGAQEKLEALERVLADLTPLWEGVVDPALREMWKEAWATNGASLGIPTWAPLAPLTLALKLKAGRAGMGTLRNTNDLYKSLVFRGDSQGLTVLTPQRGEWGSRVFYARYHQDGVPKEKHKVFGRPGGSMPARKLIPPGKLPAKTADRIKAGAVAFVKEALA